MGIGQNLAVRDVSLYYGTFKALDEVSLVCEPGQFTTILGSSGSGKTTLLKAIAGFERISSGKIFINGEDVAVKKAYERNIGMLFQNYALFPHLTIGQNIAYPLRLRRMKKDLINKKVSDVLELVKLAALRDRYPKELSGGQQQRIALARALVYEPSLLLLDEPLGALDMSLRHDMQFEIKRITRELGITTVSVTHDQEEAFAMSDLICIMSSGKVQQFAEPRQIYARPANIFVATFMGTTNIIPAKLIKTETLGSVRTLTVQTPLCADPLTLTDNTGRAASLKPGAEFAFALRPEDLHLCKKKDDLCANRFNAKLTECVYLGSQVKAHAAAGAQLLNVTLAVKEFESADLKNEVCFAFDAADVALLLD